MTLRDLKREHPGRVCVCRPHLRDVESNQVTSWFCLQTFNSLDAAKSALERFEFYGAEEAVLISTNRQINIEGELAARYYRVLKGTAW